MNYTVNRDKGYDLVLDGEPKHFNLGEQFTAKETKALRRDVAAGYLEDEKVNYKKLDKDKPRPDYVKEDEVITDPTDTLKPITK